jgi:hypothetical protein
MAREKDWFYHREADFTALCDVWNSTVVNGANQTAYDWPSDECSVVNKAINTYKGSVSTYKNTPTTANHHQVGLRHYAQKSYPGTIRDIYLYEITRQEYFDWKSLLLGRRKT